MAFWIEGRDNIRSDNNRIGGNGEIIRYCADTVADVSLLPRPNGQNQGSSCLVLEDKSFYKLGANTAVGVNGWVKI